MAEFIFQLNTRKSAAILFPFSSLFCVCVVDDICGALNSFCYFQMRLRYILFAAEPYETIAFKVPNRPIDKSEGKFSSNWDDETKTLTVQFYFEKTQGR
jgi:hypothetical protein